VPSSNWTVICPDRQIPVWWVWQESVPALGFDVVGPPPARLEHAAADGEVAHGDHVQVVVCREGTPLVGSVDALRVGHGFLQGGVVGTTAHPRPGRTSSPQLNAPDPEGVERQALVVLSVARVVAVRWRA